MGLDFLYEVSQTQSDTPRSVGLLWTSDQLFSVSFTRQHTTLTRGTAVAQWLRCCATNRKVAGSIPDGAIEIFH